MKLLKNRKIAILITVVLVVAATLFAVGRSLNRLAREVEAMFSDGVYLEDEGNPQLGIEAHLNNRLNSAQNFAVLMEVFPEAENEAQALWSASKTLLLAESISDKFVANEALQQAFTELLAVADKMEFSGRDKTDIADDSSSFYGAQTAILGSRYNYMAETFMKDASFFAHLLRPFAFVSPPQRFAPP